MSKCLKKSILFLTIFSAVLLSTTSAFAKNNKNGCKALNISQNQLRTALQAVISPTTGGTVTNGGLEAHMWATVVDKDGVVCRVVFSGDDRKDQWGVSRVISAQKANTAAQLSVNGGANTSGIGGLALSTANLHEPVQPGGSLFGLQFSNPVNPKVAYKGNENGWGTRFDGLRGENVGGINVFGGGLALYDAAGNVVGALGVSGDTSCADHNVAWRLRDQLGYPRPSGVAPEGHDGIIYPTALGGDDSSAFNHPGCLATEHTVWDTIK